MLSRLASIPRRAPFAFSIVYGGAKTIAADVLVQKYIEGREELDRRRSLVFLGFGVFQVGFVQYMIYSKLFPFVFKGAGTFSEKTVSQMLRDRQGLKNVMKQVGLDMLVYHPCCYFPVFYSCQEIVSGNLENPAKTIRDAIQKYIPNAFDDCKSLWKIFVPVSIFQNSICPVYLRVPCVATAGFFYCCILSMSRGAAVNPAADVAQEMTDMSDEHFEQCLGAIRGHYLCKDGVGREEFARIMGKLGLGEASASLFEALDDSEGLNPRRSGVIDVIRLLDGMKLLAGRCLPEDRGTFLATNPQLLLQEVPARVREGMSHMNGEEFERRVGTIRSRYLGKTEGIGREEFTLILGELGLAEVSTALFEALDASEGIYPRRCGVVDAIRFTECLKVLAGQCSPDERTKFISDNPRLFLEQVPSRARTTMASMSDGEFERCLAAVRTRYLGRTEGVGREEFALLMDELGLGEVSTALFEALDDSDGLHPRRSGVVDAIRLVEGLKLLAGQLSHDERLKFLSAAPRFLLEEVPAPMRKTISTIDSDEFEDCVASIRSRQWSSKDGVSREEFAQIMEELGLGEVSAALFEALDDSEGLYPRGSGTIDLARFTDGMKLLCGRCLPEERKKFIAANPCFLPSEVPPRLARSVSQAYK